MNENKLVINSQRKKANSKKVFEFANKLFDILTIIAILGLFLTVILQIVGRLIGYPAPWTEEGARFLFTWMIFLGIGIGFRRSESARVTILVDRMPKQFKKISTLLYTMFSLGFFLFMLIYGIQLMQQQISMNEMGSALMIPMWMLGLCVPTGAVLGIMGIIENLLFYPELIDGGDEL